MQTVLVEAGSRTYPIVVEPGLLSGAARVLLDACPSPSSVVVLTHPRLAEPYARPLLAQFAGLRVRAMLVIVPAGERHKNLRTVSRLYDRLLDSGADRKCLLVTLGGGVIGDMGGFVAATYLRGIAFAQVPTTLLAQVDASVGGKTGVDLPRGKNLVGAFKQPHAVLIDPSTLASLPRRELRSGTAEVVKHGIIRDETFFARVAEDIPRLLRRDPETLCHAVVRSCQIKAEVVRQDELEHGLRAILNFGHTVGHAIEAVTGYRRYRHGEAVSVGMVSAALIGEEVGATASATTDAIRQPLRRAGLPVDYPGDVPVEAVLEAMKRDKKATGGRISFVLATRIGEVTLRSDVPTAAVERALYRQRDRT